MHEQPFFPTHQCIRSKQHFLHQPPPISHPEPQILVTHSSKASLSDSPTHESHVQASIICCRKHNLRVRVRSGGHDYSYISNDPHVIVDLFDMRSIEVDIGEETAWVQAGATVGELYYRLAEKSKIRSFPAGVCPTVGVGGHFSGGGIGTLMRKYGLAADNVIDASFVDSHGRILDGESMGEDLFWAVRGGGASSFGVVIS